jgi:hypothetical protein
MLHKTKIKSVRLDIFTAVAIMMMLVLVNLPIAGQAVSVPGRQGLEGILGEKPLFSFSMCV